MAQIDRIRVALTGFPGGPGVCTFYAKNATTMGTPLQNLWGVLLLRMPVNVSLQVASAGDRIDDTTGALVGSWSIAPQVGLVGAAAGVYAGPVGLALSWLTSTVADGKRIRGRTFAVPMAQNVYSTNGSAEDSNLAAIRTACADFVTATAANFVVWHRPRLARAADGSRPAVTARPGSSADVTSSIVVDRIAVLRSRRG